MAIYTYPVHGFGFMPNPDSVQDHDTVEDAYATLIDDIRVTCEHEDIGMPTDLPTLEDVQESVTNGNGLIYGLAGWLHVVGVDA